MRAWLELTRPGNALMTGAAVVLGAYAAGGAPALAPAWRVALLAATGVLFAAGANSLNDAGDAAIDRGAHPGRPVPSGRVSARAARGLGVLLLTASVLPTAVAAPRALAVVGAALVLELAYETRAKGAGLPGNVLVAALAAAPFVLGAVGVGDPRPEVLVFAALAAVATFGREVVKDLEDASHDEGRTTLARRDPAAAARL
ncbi:MAG TPA: UbiA family prenyltransferase, partial [Candidatus Thermoplasmatota archaeon]|nr:UbiA family prenyltransferase [Candidatus Thermoplasmatota archaeon]